MSDILPLQIHPWPVDDETMERVREAKASLNLDLKVLPTKAVPGMHARVLALGELPPWVCDAALVRDLADSQSLSKALEWLLTAPQGDDRGFMALDYMKAIFGPETVEIPLPDCHCGEVCVVVDHALQPGCAVCNEAGCHLTKGLCFRD